MLHCLSDVVFDYLGYGDSAAGLKSQSNKPEHTNSYVEMGLLENQNASEKCRKYTI